MSMINAILVPRVEEDETGVATRIVRKGMFVGVILVGGFFLWAGIAPLSGAVIASGKVKISTNRKTVQHLEGGIIRQILVQEGDVVKQGQPLLLLENTRSSADLNILLDQYDALRAKFARLTAEKSLASRISFPQDLFTPVTEKRKELVAKEKAAFDTGRKILSDQLMLLRSELAHSKKAADSYQLQIDAIEENIRYKEEQVAMRENLLQKNFIGKGDLLNYKQSLTDKKELLGAQAADYNSARARISNLELRIVDVKNRYIQEADNELKEVSRQQFEIAERIRPAEDAMTRRTVTAPIGGQVIALKVTTDGGVIAPGQPLLDIVPLSRDLVIEIKVKNTDIDAVYPGQSAEIQLNAYNQRTTPMVQAEVIYVAGDAVEDPQTHEMSYLAHVKIKREGFKLLNHVKVEPGMPATAYIKTQDRTMMDYLISPITQRMRQTFREE